MNEQAKQKMTPEEAKVKTAYRIMAKIALRMAQEERETQEGKSKEEPVQA